VSQLKQWRSAGWRRFFVGTVLASGLAIPVFAVSVVGSSGVPSWQKVVFCVAAVPCWLYQLRLLREFVRTARAADRVAAGRRRT
jgi:hypothetical protein